MTSRALERAKKDRTGAKKIGKADLNSGKKSGTKSSIKSSSKSRDRNTKNKGKR